MEDPLFDTITQALVLAKRGNLAIVEEKLRGIQECLHERHRSMAKTRHDLGNLLSIAEASVEAMLDGVVPITDARLSRISDLLREASASLRALSGDAD